MKYTSIEQLIGNTPHLRLSRLFPEHNVWLKLERQNPGASIKDRIALAMVDAAEKSGALRAGGHLIEPTSGNTGIGLAMVCARRGYRLTLTMPESMSIERRKLLALLGAELVLTPKEQGMKGSIAKAEELLKENPGSISPGQFINPANPEIHRKTTAVEIAADFSTGLDYLITGVGTGGHITGCAEILKSRFPALKVLAVEPDKTKILVGGAHSPHRIQGIGAGFIPAVLKTELLDGVIHVSEEEAFKFAKEAARQEGLIIGISSGATLAAISQKLPDVPNDKVILGFCYDTGERYLSIEQFGA
jgi:cysteine synthase A